MPAKSLKALRSNLRFISNKFPYAAAVIAGVTLLFAGLGFLLVSRLWG